MRRRKLTSTLLTLSLVVLSTPAFGQKQEVERKAEVERQAVVTAAQGGGGVYTFSGSTNGGFAFASADGQVATVVNAFGVGDTLVKGQPFSAQAVSESIQSLSDGNRIVRKSSTMIYRDNEGRTRREQTIKAVGPIAVEGNDAKMIYINDPVSGVNFTLDERNKTARKYVIPTTAQGKKAYAEGYAAGSSYAYSTGGQGGAVTVTQADVEKKVALEAKMKEVEKAKEKAVESGQMIVSGNAIAVANGSPLQASTYTIAGQQKYPRKEESLGKQTMEGVEVEGVRHTTTIPAGEIGNEMPINMITEKWYSDELKQVVYLKTSDPRFGETIYRLTNIVRENPDRSLFDVPSDYTVREFKPAVVTGTTVAPKPVEEQKKKTAKPQQ